MSIVAEAFCRLLRRSRRRPCYGWFDPGPRIRPCRLQANQRGLSGDYIWTIVVRMLAARAPLGIVLLEGRIV